MENPRVQQMDDFGSLCEYIGGATPPDLAEASEPVQRTPVVFADADGVTDPLIGVTPRPQITFAALFGTEPVKKIMDVHEGCRARGFYDGVGPKDLRHHASIVSLFGTEITESFVDLYEEGGHHLGEELADVVLRVTDYIGFLAYGAGSTEVIHTFLSSPRAAFRITRVDTRWALLEAHRANSMALEALRRDQIPTTACAYLCFLIFQIAEQYDIDLVAEFNTKLEKNKNRPPMHGGKKF